MAVNEALHGPPSRAGRRIPLALLAAGVGALVAFALWPRPLGPGEGSAEQEAWDLPALAGEGRVRLAEFEGRPLVLNFFASWCKPCAEELPVFAKVSRELQGRVAFAGVNSQDGGNGLAMARSLGVGWWPLARDIGEAESALHAAVGALGMPVTVFYDAAGKRVDFFGGPLDEKTLRERIESLYGIP